MFHVVFLHCARPSVKFDKFMGKCQSCPNLQQLQKGILYKFYVAKSRFSLKVSETTQTAQKNQDAYPRAFSDNLIVSRTRSGGREPSLSRTSVSYRVAPYPYRIHIVSASYRIVSRGIVSYRVVSLLLSLSLSLSYRTMPLSYRIRIVSVSSHEPLYRIASSCIVSSSLFIEFVMYNLSPSRAACSLLVPSSS